VKIRLEWLRQAIHNYLINGKHGDLPIVPGCQLDGGHEQGG
jgi:hypothetical protein